MKKLLSIILLFTACSANPKVDKDKTLKDPLPQQTSEGTCATVKIWNHHVALQGINAQTEIANRFCKEVDFLLYGKKQTVIGIGIASI